MKTKDFNSILDKTFNPDIYKDATPKGEEFIKYFDGSDLDKIVYIVGDLDCKLTGDIVKLLKPTVSTVKDECGISLYVICDKPLTEIQVAELIKSAVINPKGTFFVANTTGFVTESVKDMIAIGQIVSDFGGSCLITDKVDPKEVVKPINKVKRGFASTMVMQMQEHPIKFGGVHGIQVYDLIVLSRSIIQFFNDKFGSVFNADTIKLLKMAIREQEARTADREARKVEGYAKI